MLHPTTRTAVNRIECSRPKCPKVARNGGLCRGHHEHKMGGAIGYLDAAVTQERIRLLRQRGFGWQQLAEATGVSDVALQNIGGRVQARTQQKVLAVPVPEGIVGEGGLVHSTGTIRRIQALAVAGYTFTQISRESGVSRRRLSEIMRSSRVYARTAAQIGGVFTRLELTPGPSALAHMRAVGRGWHPSLAWDLDTIDDPSARPAAPVHASVTWLEKYTELRELGVPESRIPERMGIDAKSLSTQLRRLGIIKGAA